MTTSAQDRFEQLFANKPRPTKPAVERQIPPTDTQQRQSHHSSPIEHTEGRTAALAAHLAAVELNDKDAASSEDDEYAALFEKKPEMKSKPLKNQPKPELGISECSKDDRQDTMKPVEYVPEGKASSRTLKVNNQDDTADGADAATYNGNGRSLIGRYCPLQLVAKFPYKYMNDPNDRVSRRFFADGEFYRRRWHLHYLHPPQSFYKGALLLVPFPQVQELIDEIASEFKIKVDVPSFPFTLEFYDDETPSPVFLATTVSRDGVSEKINLIPGIQEGHGECPPFASADLKSAYEVYHDKVERALLAVKGKTTSSGQKKAKKLFQTLEESRNQLKRTEKYLGIRPRTKPLEPSPGLSWDEEKAFKERQQRICGLVFDFLDVHKPAQYPFEEQPIFIAIDVEAYERNHGFITEIGISTLDTLDLVEVPPGLAGKDWVKQIRSRHFRIRGREHLVNREFCIGNPDAFQFGKSEFVSLHDVADAVDSCFEWPFSVQFKKEGPTAPLCGDYDNEIADINPATIQKGSKTRNLVIVGHDVGTDLVYLRNLGSEIFDPQLPRSAGQGTPSKSDRYRILASIIETLDTASMYKSFRSELQPRNLSHICNDLGIEPWFAHNAGNDARYTLEAMLKLAIQARLDEDNGQRMRDPQSTGVVEDDWEAQKMRHIDDRIESARRKVQRKVLTQDENTINDTNTSTIADPNNIDWSLPIRSKKSEKSRQLGTSAEEQIQTPRAGW